MATIAAAANGNWSANATWSGGVVPGDGDTADLHGYVVATDISTIPANGTLALIENTTGTGGKLTINMSANGLNANATINATNIQAGASTVGLIYAATSASGKLLTINGNVLGGTGTLGYGVYFLAYSASCTINGTVTGGSGTTAHGFYPDTGATYGTFTFNGNLYGGSGTRAWGVMMQSTSIATVVFGAINLIDHATGGPAYSGPIVTWNKATTNYTTRGGVNWYYDVPALSAVLTSATVGGVSGTFNEAARNTDPGIANVANGVAYKIANVSLTGTLSGGGGIWMPDAQQIGV